MWFKIALRTFDLLSNLLYVLATPIRRKSVAFERI